MRVSDYYGRILTACTHLLLHGLRPAEGYADADPQVVTPLLVASQKVAIPEGQIIELHDAHGEVVRRFDVETSAKPQSQVCVRGEVFDFATHPANHRVRETFKTIAARRQARAEQEGERSEINVRARQLNLFFVIAEIGDDAKMTREISCDAKASAVKTFALAEEIAFVVVVKRVIEIDVGAEMRVAPEDFEFRVVALRINRQRHDEQDCGQ